VFSVTVTSWHCGGSGKTDEAFQDLPCLLADPPTSQAAGRFAWFSLETPTKSTCFNRAFKFYQLTIFQQNPVQAGDFQAAP